MNSPQQMKAELIKRVRWMADLDPTSWVEHDGTLKVPLNELPEEVRYCIRAIETRTTKKGSTVKVKFESPTKAAKLLRQMGIQDSESRG